MQHFYREGRTSEGCQLYKCKACSTSLIVKIIPVTFAGLGAREAAVLLFEKAGFPATQVLGGIAIVAITSFLLLTIISVATAMKTKEN